MTTTKEQKYLVAADLFCGAGGTSQGLCEAAGLIPQYGGIELTAINHWETAVDTHSLNHATAKHLCASVDSINPRHHFEDGQLDVLWASPECTHHSVARGGRPVKDQSRATPWCVARWADALHPKTILVENVKEFRHWGPTQDGQPIPSKKGKLFQAWIANLEAIGYTVDHRVLCCADYGDPTTRKRLFVQAQLGDREIVWPEATHGEDAPRAWVPAKEIIDWSIESRSIYPSMPGGRPKPLAANTLKRIAEGLKKFGGEQFIATVSHTGGSDSSRVKALSEPLQAITAKNNKALCEPFIVPIDNASSKARPEDINEPLSTVVASNPRHGLIEPFITEFYGQGRAQKIDKPLPTVTTKARFGVVEPFILPQHSGGAPRPVSKPLPTVATAGAISLVEPTTFEQDGTTYVLDIKFRMLQPSELAAAQGFLPSYQFTGNKTEITKQIGNAVPRRTARALAIAAITQDPSVEEFIE
tara:strand:- start:8807 stop:10225 length:1419 start_codon:yes stop_codon:yes gene_type:complete